MRRQNVFVTNRQQPCLCCLIFQHLMQIVRKQLQADSDITFQITSILPCLLVGLVEARGNKQTLRDNLLAMEGYKPKMLCYIKQPVCSDFFLSRSGSGFFNLKYLWASGKKPKCVFSQDEL